MLPASPYVKENFTSRVRRSGKEWVETALEGNTGAGVTFPSLYHAGRPPCRETAAASQPGV